MAAPVSSGVAQLERTAHVLSHQSAQSALAASDSVGLVALHPPGLGVAVAAEPSGGAFKASCGAEGTTSTGTPVAASGTMSLPDTPASALWVGVGVRGRGCG